VGCALARLILSALNVQFVVHRESPADLSRDAELSGASGST
jgi:hypothetical protein